MQHIRVVLEAVACPPLEAATIASTSDAAAVGRSSSAWLASRPHVELVEASVGALGMCLAVERQRSSSRSGGGSGAGRADEAEALADVLEPALSTVRTLLAALRPLVPSAAAENRGAQELQKARRLVLVGLMRRILDVLAQIAGALPHEQHTPLLPLLVGIFSKILVDFYLPQHLSSVASLCKGGVTASIAGADVPGGAS